MFVYCHTRISIPVSESDSEDHIEEKQGKLLETMELINLKRFLKSIFTEAYPDIKYTKVTEKPSFILTQPDKNVELITGSVFWDTLDVKDKVTLTKKIQECDVQFEFFPFTDITMSTN